MKKTAIIFLIIISILLTSVFALSACNYAGDEGEIYTLQGIYDRGWLSKEDLSSIAQKHANNDCSSDDLPYTAKRKILSTLRYNYNARMEKYGFEDYEEQEYKIVAYYGKYDNIYVFAYSMVEEIYPETTNNEIIDGFSFEFGTGGIYLSAFIENKNAREYTPEQKGEFYTLGQAYEQGFLNIDDIRNVAYYQNTLLGIDYAVKEGLIQDDYVPLPLNPEKLSYADELAIRESAAYDCTNAADTADYKDAAPEDFVIEKYYGTYNGCVVIMMHKKGQAFNGALWSETIEDVFIQYLDGNSICVWKAKD